MTGKYKVAIVGGAGTWGRYYTRAYAKHPECEIVGLVDRSKDRRDDIAKRYGIKCVFDELGDLLSVDVPDIVSAIVPVSQNYSCVTACASAGVRVVSCEKPISSELQEADEMVRFCRDNGTLFGCGMAAWATPYMADVINWVRQGNIGPLTSASIPGGLPVEVSGAGCVQIGSLRLLTGMDVVWVEGYTLPEIPGYVADGTAAEESDVPAFGKLGLSGGIECAIARPEPGRTSTHVSVEGENGKVFCSRPLPVLIQGSGASSRPVQPEFLQHSDLDLFDLTIQRLLDAHESGKEPLSSGDDFRHSLEVAIGLVRSSCTGHERVSLPLSDRSLKLLPHPYRLNGGDVAGWETIGYTGPPTMDF